MPETYIIFILENDPSTFKNGEAIIGIDRHKITGEKYDDGLHKLLVNAAYRGTDAIGKLMHDFRVSSPQEMHHKPLANRVKYFKYEEVANTMCELFEKFGAEKEKEGQREQMEKTVLSVVEDGIHNIETIAKYAATTVEVVQEILDKHQIVLKPAPTSN